MPKVIDYITQAAIHANDTGHVTWSQADWLRFYNESMSAVVIVRPDAYSVKKAITLAAGIYQELPSDDLWLHRILYNYVGDIVGNAVRGPKKREEADAVDPSWPTHAANADDTIEEYLWSRSEPTKFEVYPQATASSKVMAVVAQVPADATDADNDDVALSAKYRPAQIDWMLYRAFCGDHENSPNWVRAAQFFRNFFNILGAKMQSDMAASPNVLEQNQEQTR